jgi:subfamily B ATP-binding cassette protein MsbA
MACFARRVVRKHIWGRIVQWFRVFGNLDRGKDQLPLDTTLAIMQRLVRDRARDHAGGYALAFVFMGFVALATALSAWIMKDVINEIFVERNEAALTWVPMAIIAIFVGKGFATYFQEVILSRIGNAIVADAQKQMFDHVLAMDANFYQDHPSNDLTMRITIGAQAARDMLNLIAVSLGRDLFTLISLVVVMISMNPTLAAIALLVGPFASFGLRKMVKRVQKAARSEVMSLAAIIGIMRETAQGVRIVKSFQLEPLLQTRMFGAIEAVQRLGNRIARTQAGVNPLIETLGGVAIAAVVTYAGWKSMGSAEAPGEFFAFITSLLLAADPARRLSKMQLQLATSAIMVRMMYELLDTPAAELEEKPKPDLVVKDGAVRFDTVSFAYRPDNIVLDRVSLEAPAGSVTALIGPSGGGKTTVFNLIQHFWKPTDGQILIDGQDIDSVSLRSLRRHISLVSQDVFLFEGTIRENITAGRDDVTDEQLHHATKLAHAHDFIEALPHKYATPVGELGAQISGGQRQRISIARAFLKDAPIVLLDEPTSALDSESEQAIQKALRELTRGRTTLVIAHRMSTIMHADVIHVIQAGRVVETGTHSELVAADGLYERLFRIQFKNDDTQTTLPVD